MKHRKILTLLLCAALLTATVGAAFVPQAKESSPIVWGSVTENKDGTIRVQNSAGTGLSDVVIHMQEDAPVVDAVTGAAVKLADVKIGQTVYVTIAPIMTMSLPPQTAGLAAVVNPPADYKVPQYGVIGAITAGDGKEVLAEILTDDGMLLGRVNAKTILGRYVKPGEAAILSLPTVDELKPGCGVFLWYGASTRSIPAQTTLEKVVIVPSQYDGYASVSEDSISYNDKALDGAKAMQTEAGDVLVPLRAVAEAAGWKLTWSGKDQPIVLTKGDASVTLALGSSEITLGGDAVYTLPLATQMQNGATYVSAELLPLALNVYLGINA